MKTSTSISIVLCILLLTFSCSKDDETTTETPIEIGNNILPTSLILKEIPAGTFIMGGTTIQGDAPTVSITLTAFQISEKEITNQQYIEFLNNAYIDGWITIEEQKVSGYGEAPYAGEAYIQLSETGGVTTNGEEEHIDNRSWISFNSTANKFQLLDDTKSDWPVNWVKWFGAFAYAEYYNVSLPTEAQWESAARGGQQYDYPTDDGTISLEKANYNGDTPAFYNPDGHSVAVGSYQPNPYGLYDMGGNVWEWCQDYYSETFYEDGSTDPLNTTASSDSKRVRRGGAWNYHTTTLQTFARAYDPPTRGNNHFGFRIAKN